MRVWHLAEGTFARKTWQDTTGTGDLTEFTVLLALLRKGYRVLRPVSSASRYDVVIDNGEGTFTRVQCKTGRLGRRIWSPSTR